jgi:VanZ family protein
LPEEIKPSNSERTDPGWLRTLHTRYPLLLYWGPPMVWAVLIFCLSSQPGEAFPEVTFLPHADKAVHIVEYAVLAALAGRALLHYTSGPYKIPAFTVAFIACVLFGLLDELHQISVPDRSFEWADLGADAIGSALGLIIFALARLGAAKRNSASQKEA